ncbi:MAG: DoxX family protein [bacterium]|nr:DoxX family protein [bacterium]
MNRRDLVIYRIVTGIFTVHMLFTAVVYFAMHNMVADMFESLGVPTGMIYPLAIAKVLGLVAIWTNKSKLLKELAYIGFAIDFVLAISTHLMANDGGAAGALVALVFLSTSYFFNRKVYGTSLKSA